MKSMLSVLVAAVFAATGFESLYHSRQPQSSGK